MVGREAIRFPQEAGAQLEKTPLPWGSLPALPGYEGEVASIAQNIQYDEQGNVLFFLVDGNMYNGQGQLIGDAAQDEADADCHVCLFAQEELHVLPIPGRCAQFFIVSLYKTTANNATRMRVGVLDMRLASDLPFNQNGSCTPVMGRFISNWQQQFPDPGEIAFNFGSQPGLYGTPVPTLASGYPEYTYLWDLDFLTYGAQKAFHAATLKIQGDPQERSIMAIRANQTLTLLLVSQNGLSVVPNSTNGLQYYPLWDPVIGYDVSDGDGSFRGQLSMAWNDGILRVAHTHYTLIDPEPPGIWRHQMGITEWRFGLQLVNDQPQVTFSPVVIGTGQNPKIWALDDFPVTEQVIDGLGQLIERPAVAGLQYSPDGTKLYFTKSTAREYWFPPQGTTASTFGYIDVTWTLGSSGTYHHYLPIASPQETRKLADTELQLHMGLNGAEPALYMLSTELDGQGVPVHWLGVFTDPDNPDPANFELRKLDLEVLATRTGETPSVYRILNPRVRGSDQYAIMQAPSCCQDMARTRDRSMTIQATCGGVWTPGSNPFYNTSEPVFIASELRIAAGASVNAQDLEFQFAENATLVVEAGAYFNANNCLFTASCGNTWKGIRVEGTTSDLSQSQAFQGRLNLENGSIVEHAEVGVWTLRQWPNGAMDANGYGGRVRTDQATIRDCAHGVIIENYNRYHPNGNLLPNLSQVTNTSFITTDAWRHPGTPAAHLYLHQVNGVQVLNSNFNNADFQAWQPNKRGWGLVSLDATFRCLGGMQPENSFNNLTGAVVASNPSPTKGYVLDGMHFGNNWMSVVDMGSRSSRITNNTIVTLSLANGLEGITSSGILLYQSEGYTIERNTVISDVLQFSVPSVGIVFMGNAFQGNQVYENDFIKLQVGCWVAGMQRNPFFDPEFASGLQMRCNDYTDIGISQLITQNGYIQMEQGAIGDPELLANNTFLTTVSCDLDDAEAFHIYVAAAVPYDLFVKYNFYGNANSPEMRPRCIEASDGTPESFVGDLYYDLVSVQQPIAFDQEVHCITGVLDIEDLGGNGITGLVGQLDLKVAELGSAMAAYKGIVDKGVKQDLVAALRHQPWHPSHYLRDLLLAHKPLSNEVIMAMLQRPEPMDPWHLTQVLIDNSELARWVWYYLDEHQVLPTYFYNLLLQFQQGGSPRQAIGMEVVQRQHEKNELLRRIGFTLASDSLAHLPRAAMLHILKADSFGDGLRNSYIFHLEEQDFVSSTALEGKLSGSEWTEGLVELGVMYARNNGDWSATDATERQELMDMAFGHAPSAGAQAWAVLLALNELDTIPMPDLPGLFKTEMPRRFSSSAPSMDPMIVVLPNPAQDRLAITYPADMEQGSLELFDAQGRLMRTLPLQGRRGMVETSVLGWDAGLYLVRLQLAGFEIGSAKFTVVK